MMVEARPSFCIICWPRLAKARQAVGNLVTKVECPPTLCNCLPLINTSSIYLLETREWAQDHAQTRMKPDWRTVGVSSESLNMHSRVNVTEGMNCVHTFQMPFLLSALAYNTRAGNVSACTICTASYCPTHRLLFYVTTYAISNLPELNCSES